MLDESGLPAPSVNPAAGLVLRTYPAEYSARVMATGPTQLRTEVWINELTNEPPQNIDVNVKQSKKQMSRLTSQLTEPTF
jgi:hypothetical protein